MYSILTLISDIDLTNVYANCLESNRFLPLNFIMTLTVYTVLVARTYFCLFFQTQI